MSTITESTITICNNPSECTANNRLEDPISLEPLIFPAIKFGPMCYNLSTIREMINRL